MLLQPAKTSKTASSCDQCEHTTKTKNGIKQNKKNKHYLQQIDGNSSICEEEVETPSYECSFCEDDFESEIRQHCIGTHFAEDLRQQGDQMHQQSLQGGFPPGML